MGPKSVPETKTLSNNNCDTFNGTVVEELASEAKQGHWNGGLVLNHGKPTAVGGQNYPRSNRGYTEKLGEKGWEKLTPHPRLLDGVVARIDSPEIYVTYPFRCIERHSAVELPSGSIATLGGFDQCKREQLKGVWSLNKSEWTGMKDLLQVRIQVILLKN